MAATAKHLRSLPLEPEIRHGLKPEDLTPIVPSYPGGPNQVPAGLFAWETLDRYKLVSPLGHGGMAEVFLAAQEVDAFVHRPVVVKRLHAHLAADPNIVQMF